MTMLRYTNGPRVTVQHLPAVAWNAGDVIVVGNLPLIADTDNPPGSGLPIRASALHAFGGIYKGLASEADVVGTYMYWDTSVSQFTSTVSGTTYPFGWLVSGPTGMASDGGSTGNGSVCYVLHDPQPILAISLTSITFGTTPAQLTGQAALTLTSAGGAIAIAGAAGGATSGAGGAVSVTGGAGTLGNSVGGAVSLTGGAGSATNAAGGAASVTGGAGAGSSAGGAANMVGGLAGATGVGGQVTITAGAGGATSGAGGQVVITGGAGQLGSSAGGAVSLTGGAGSATNAAGGAASLIGGLGAGSSAGGAITITSGAAGATGVAGAVNISVGGATAGAGSSVTITGGAGAGGTAAGGQINLIPGTAVSTGIPGEVQINSAAGIFSANWQQYLAASVPVTGTSYTFFIADRAYRVKGARCVCSSSATVPTVDITKDTGTTAPGAGSSVLTGVMTFNTTANTIVVGTANATVATVTLAAGDRLSTKWGGTVGAITGAMVSVLLVPV